MILRWGRRLRIRTLGPLPPELLSTRWNQIRKHVLEELKNTNRILVSPDITLYSSRYNARDLLLILLAGFLRHGAVSWTRSILPSGVRIDHPTAHHTDHMVSTHRRRSDGTTAGMRRMIGVDMADIQASKRFLYLKIGPVSPPFETHLLHHSHWRKRQWQISQPPITMRLSSRKVFL